MRVLKPLVRHGANIGMLMVSFPIWNLWTIIYNTQIRLSDQQKIALLNISQCLVNSTNMTDARLVENYDASWNNIITVLDISIGVGYAPMFAVSNKLPAYLSQQQYTEALHLLLAAVSILPLTIAAVTTTNYYFSDLLASPWFKLDKITLCYLKNITRNKFTIIWAALLGMSSLLEQIFFSANTLLWTFVPSLVVTIAGGALYFSLNALTIANSASIAMVASTGLLNSFYLGLLPKIFAKLQLNISFTAWQSKGYCEQLMVLLKEGTANAATSLVELVLLPTTTFLAMQLKISTAIKQALTITYNYYPLGMACHVKTLIAVGVANENNQRAQLKQSFLSSLLISTIVVGVLAAINNDSNGLMTVLGVLYSLGYFTYTQFLSTLRALDFNTIASIVVGIMLCLGAVAENIYVTQIDPDNVQAEQFFTIPVAAVVLTAMSTALIYNKISNKLSMLDNGQPLLDPLASSTAKSSSS